MKLAQILKEMLNEIGETTYQISGPKIVSSNPNSNVVKYFFTALPKKEPKDANEPEDEQPEDSKEEPKGTKYEVVFESEFLSGSDEHKWETEISFDKIGEEEEEEEEEGEILEDNEMEEDMQNDIDEGGSFVTVCVSI